MKKNQNTQSSKPEKDKGKALKPNTQGIRLDDLIPTGDVKGGRKVIFGFSQNK